MPGNLRTRQVVEGFAYSQDPKYFSRNAVFIVEPSSESYKGRDAIKTMLDRFYRDAFADASSELVNVAADSEKGLGFIEFVFRGRPKGEIGNLLSSKFVEIPMLGVYEVDGDTIKNARLYYDVSSILKSGSATHE